MTVAQLTALILSWLDDEQQGYFNATDVLAWLNMAHRQVQMYLLQAGENYYVKPVETQTINGQSDYLLPSDFMVEHRLELVLSGTGPSENRQQLGMITTNQQDMISITLGVPSNYYIKKDRVTLSPTPQQAYTLRLYYSPMVADLALLTDIPDIPNQYMEAVAILAACNGFIKDDRVPTNILEKKNEFIMLMKQMAETRVQDQSRQVVMVTDYDAMGSWF